MLSYKVWVWDNNFKPFHLLNLHTSYRLFFLYNLYIFFQDKTFGLKNKKGAKQQKFIKAVTQQVKYGQQNPRQVGITIVGINSQIIDLVL